MIIYIASIIVGESFPLLPSYLCTRAFHSICVTARLQRTCHTCFSHLASDLLRCPSLITSKLQSPMLSSWCLTPRAIPLILSSPRATQPPRTTMAFSEQPLKCELQDDAVVINDDLRITFQRTIRVPDNQQTSCLPPTLGSFPLKPISKHVKNLPASMAAKGGVFLPMFRKGRQPSCVPGITKH